jgi:hypothetical protein
MSHVVPAHQFNISVSGWLVDAFTFPWVSLPLAYHMLRPPWMPRELGELGVENWGRNLTTLINHAYLSKLMTCYQALVV